MIRNKTIICDFLVWQCETRSRYSTWALFVLTQFVSPRIDFSFSHTCQVHQCFNSFLHFMCANASQNTLSVSLSVCVCVCVIVCLCVCVCVFVWSCVCFAITIDIICMCVALAITSGDSSLPLVKVRRGTNFQTKGKRGWCSKEGFSCFAWISVCFCQFQFGSDVAPF